MNVNSYTSNIYATLQILAFLIMMYCIIKTIRSYQHMRKQPRRCPYCNHPTSLRRYFRWKSYVCESCGRRSQPSSPWLNVVFIGLTIGFSQRIIDHYGVLSFIIIWALVIVLYGFILWLFIPLNPIEGE